LTLISQLTRAWYCFFDHVEKIQEQPQLIKGTGHEVQQSPLFYVSVTFLALTVHKQQQVLNFV